MVSLAARGVLRSPTLPAICSHSTLIGIHGSWVLFMHPHGDIHCLAVTVDSPQCIHSDGPLDGNRQPVSLSNKLGRFGTRSNIAYEAHRLRGPHSVTLGLDPAHFDANAWTQLVPARTVRAVIERIVAREGWKQA